MRERAPRPLLVGLALAAASLAVLEIGARVLLAVVPSLGDPWSGRVGATTNAALVRQMEQDLTVVAQRQALYVPDRRLFWRLAPGVDMQVENEVLETRGAPVTWTIRTNALGFRGPDRNAPSGLRVLALGDSCTFGFRVAEEATYAARLEAICAPQRVTVLNAGVPGYTTHQGTLLLASLLDTYRPDVVTIAFGTNDRETDPLTDAERSAWLDTAIGRLTWGSQRSGVFRVLSGLLARPASPSTGAKRRRVDVDAFGANVEEMVALARRASARVVLLDLVYVGPIYREALQAIAARSNVPLVDGRAALDAAYVEIDRGAAYREEAEAWRRFYVANVVSVRPVYFDRTFYAEHYATERAEQQFITLMADPIHPNAIGHHVLADALAPLVCPEADGRGRAPD